MVNERAHKIEKALLKRFAKSVRLSHIEEADKLLKILGEKSSTILHEMFEQVNYRLHA